MHGLVRESRSATGGNVHRRPLEASHPGRKHRHARPPWWPRGPAKVSGSLTRLPGRRLSTAASRSRMVPAPGLPCGTRVPVAPPAQWPGTDGACVHVPVSDLCLPGGRAWRGRPGVFFAFGRKVQDTRFACSGMTTSGWAPAQCHRGQSRTAVQRPAVRGDEKEAEVRIC
jgi:hypothetical protein